MTIPSSVDWLGEAAFGCNPILSASIPDEISGIYYYYHGHTQFTHYFPTEQQVRAWCFELLPVQNLKASSSLRKVTISWDPSFAAEGYILYRQAPGETKMSYRYILSGTGFVDTVDQDGNYYYRVYPYNTWVNEERIVGKSDAYAYVSVSLIPPAVTNLKVQRNRTSALLTWNAVADVDGYVIYRQAPGETKMTYRTMGTKTGLLDAATTPGYHFYRVYAYRMIGGDRVFGPSDTYVYTNITMEPAPVTNLRVTSVGKTAQLRWTASPDADSYIIYRRAPGETTMSYLYLVTGTGFNDTVTEPGYYFYRVYPRRVLDGNPIVGKSDKYVYTNIK